MDKNPVVLDTSIPPTEAELTELIMVKVTPYGRKILWNVNNYIVTT